MWKRNKPMIMSVSRNGISVLYRCYKLPGYGRKCPDKDTNKCLRCEYSKAEMSGEDATWLLESIPRRRGETTQMEG